MKLSNVMLKDTHNGIIYKFAGDEITVKADAPRTCTGCTDICSGKLKIIASIPINRLEIIREEDRK